MNNNDRKISAEIVLNITLAEFRNNPFCPTHIIDALIGMGYNTLADIAEITQRKAQSFWGFGIGKVERLMAFVNKLRLGQIDDIILFYERNIMITSLPSKEMENRPLHEKISNVLSSICSILTDRGRDELAIICREGFLCNKTKALIHRENTERLAVTGERVRQQMTWIKDAIWRNGLMKYRVEINDSFLEELARVKEACLDQPLFKLRQFLGEGAPAHVYSNLFGFDIVSSAIGGHGAVDTEYLTSSESGILSFSRDLTAIISELHRDVRPLAFDEIYHNLLSNHGSVSPKRVMAILSNHSEVETTEDGKFQLQYGSLFDYERVARLIWEKQHITNKEININNTLRTGDSTPISINTNVAANKFPWCKPIGKTGVWAYVDEQNSQRVSVRDFIKQYVSEHDVFRFSEAAIAVKEAGYNYPEKTLRTYFTSLCCESNADKDVLCDVEKASRHNDIAWRRKRIEMANYRITDVAVRYILANGPATRSEIIDEVLRLDTEGHYTRKCAWNTLTSRIQKNDVLHLGADGRVRINVSYVKDGTLDEEKLRKESFPEHYNAVLAIVEAKLSASPDKMCLLSSLRNACEQTLKPFCNPSLFYKIITTICPAGIEKVTIGRSMYLRQIA